MRLHVMDSALMDFFGHHNHFIAGLNQMLSGTGIELIVHGNRKVADKLRHAFQVRPVFRQSTYQRLSSDPYDAVLEEMLAGAATYCADIESIGVDMPGNDDLVLVPTAGPRELSGLGSWLQRSGRRPRMAALMHRVFPPELDISPGSLGGAVYRHAGRAFTSMAGEGRFLIGATNASLAEYVAPALGCVVHALPVPIWYGDGNVAVGSTDSAEPTVAFLGDMRPEKGYRVTPVLVRGMHKRALPMRCVIHLGVSRDVSDLSEYRTLREEGLAEVIKGWLSEEEMLALVQRASLVVLPYDRRFYSRNISGVFSLAVAAGRPCVVPDKSWMGEQVGKGTAAGVCYSSDEADRILDAVAAALQKLPELNSAAGGLAGAWRRDQSAAALVTQILRWAGAEKLLEKK